MGARDARRAHRAGIERVGSGARAGAARAARAARGRAALDRGRAAAARRLRSRAGAAFAAAPAGLAPRSTVSDSPEHDPDERALHRSGAARVIRADRSGPGLWPAAAAENAAQA